MGVASRIGTKIGLLLGALALALVALAPAAAQAQGPMQLGVYLSGGGGNAGTLDNYASLVGRKPDILLVFRNMGGPLLYSSEVSNLKSRGEVPMVTLEPYTSGGVASMTAIASGQYDSYFRKEANAVKATGMTVMIRFAHEMNLLSSDWGPGKAGNSGNGYVDAWRHIVDVFRQEGATNAKWVWAPNVDYGGRPFSSFFPGDAYVDYVGLDGYNWGTSGSGSWESFSKIFASSYATITQLSSRPLIVTETASAETGGSKAAWIEQSLLETIPNKMPRTAGVIWFDDNKERDWRVNSSQSSLDAFRKVASSTLYGGTQSPTGSEEAPKVKELEVVPIVTPKPAPAPEPAPAPAPAPAPETAPTPETSPTPEPEAAPAPEMDPETTPTTTESIKPTPETAPATPETSPAPEQTEQRRHRRKKRRGITLRGRITYKLSRRATVRIALQRRGSHARPLVFTAVQRRGHKRVAIAKLVAGRRVARGKYKVSVVAFSASGRRSHPRRHGFRVVPPKHHRSHA